MLVLEKRRGNKAGVAVKAVIAGPEPRKAEPTAPAPAAQEPPAPPKKPGAKVYLRELFPNVGDAVNGDVLLANKAYSPNALTTAIADLKNAKYCGPEGQFFIEKRKDGDAITFVRIAPPSA